MERLPISYRDTAVLIPARDLMTPVVGALTLTYDEPAGEAGRTLDAAGFDYAPVLRDGGVVGYAAASDLRDSHQQISARMRSLEVALVVAGDTGFPDLLLALRDEPFLFVLEGRNPVGFVTRSDLNKHTARLHYYFLLAGLEIALANLVRLQFDPPATALKCLNVGKRKDILQRYRDLQRSSLDLDEVASADLSDLITIVRKTPKLREIFGSNSASAFERRAGWLPAFRNAVMHPSRPLVEEPDDVAGLIEREEVLRSLFEAACSRLFSQAPSSLTRW